VGVFYGERVKLLKFKYDIWIKADAIICVRVDEFKPSIRVEYGPGVITLHFASLKEAKASAEDIVNAIEEALK
jgi:hypothetical protein